MRIVHSSVAVPDLTAVSNVPDSEEIVVTEFGKPVSPLLPLESRCGKPALRKGMNRRAGDHDKPLPEETAALRGERP